MKPLASMLFIIVVVVGVSAQTITETQKIDEFGIIYNCCDLAARLDNAVVTQKANPGSKIYFLFYEGKQRISRKWNEKLKDKEPALAAPVKGEFARFEAGIRQRIAALYPGLSEVVFVNGGYRDLLTVEFWIVPKGTEPPAATPTVDEKDVHFRKGISYHWGVCNEI